ncbi:TMEM165/GDT1 family protein [Sphingomonas sp. CA1-15]|uniref:GDT1 family protein n=2 Tax=Sphingomonas immobilis TaxID=3063997 RepID=A0ABT8ZWQ7_9SPHN|nr:TMEM165/GDT1 family protein [Sphingomonas sp. CA1-15]
MAAFVAALLIQPGSRSTWLAAILADRFARPGQVIIGAVIAIAIGNAVAGFGGLWVAHILTPNARALLLALALAFAGIGCVERLKPPDPLAKWRIGAFATSLFGIGILAAGDSVQFLTFVFSIRSDAPVLAAIGATLGASVVTAAAIVAGEKARRKVPIRAIRIATGVLFLIAGAIAALSAFGLI